MKPFSKILPKRLLFFGFYYLKLRKFFSLSFLQGIGYLSYNILIFWYLNIFKRVCGTLNALYSVGKTENRRFCFRQKNAKLFCFGKFNVGNIKLAVCVVHTIADI